MPDPDAPPRESPVNINRVTINVVIVWGSFLALSGFACLQWWKSEKLLLQADQRAAQDAFEKSLDAKLTANQNELLLEVQLLSADVKKVTSFVSDSANGRFSQRHYIFLRRMLRNNPDAPWPEYDELHRMVIEYEARYNDE